MIFHSIFISVKISYLASIEDYVVLPPFQKYPYFRKKLFQKDICFTFSMYKLITNFKKHNGVYKDFIG